MRKITFPRMYLILLALVVFIFGFMALNSFLNLRTTSSSTGWPNVHYIDVGGHSEGDINADLAHDLKVGFRITHATSTYIILEK